MKNREAYYDQLRVLAIVSILSCHVAADLVSHNPDLMLHFKTFYGILLFNLGRFIGVPLFIMISGALLINKDYSASYFIKRRFNRVLIPFIFWSIIFIIFTVFVYHQDLTYDLVIKVVFGLKGTPGRILWFVWMLMCVYIGILIINSILKYGKSKSDKFEGRFINLLFILSLICYAIYNLIHIPYETISFYFSFIPYTIFGYYLTHNDFDKIKIGNRFRITPAKIVVTSFILSIACYLYFVMTVCLKSLAINNIFSASYNNYLIVIMQFSIILLFRYLPECKGAITSKVNNFLSSKYIGKAILSISICSYGIYFVHILILKYFETINAFMMSYINHPKFWVPVLVVILLLLSWIIIWIMSNIPYLNKLSGAS